MKRKNYSVTIQGQTVAVKHAYNTARRQIVAEIRNSAKVGEIWEMTKEDREIGVWCKQVWRNHMTGAEIVAEVKQTA